MTEQPKVLACGSCNIALIPIQRSASLSIAGVFSALLFVCGIVAIPMFGLVTGAVIIVMAIVISVFGRAKYTHMTCPSCGKVGSKFQS